MFAVIRAVRKSKLPFGRRSILLVLATHVTRKNAGRDIEVSVSKLAAESGASPRAVERALVSAVEVELLAMTNRPGDRRGNLYSFQPSASRGAVRSAMEALLGHAPRRSG